LSEEHNKEKIFVVYHQQRWDEVDLIKGFTNKENAEKLRKDLEEREKLYEKKITELKEILSNFEGLIETLGGI